MSLYWVDWSINKILTSTYGKVPWVVKQFAELAKSPEGPVGDFVGPQFLLTWDLHS